MESLRPDLTSGNASGEAIVRAALAEYRRCTAAYWDLFPLGEPDARVAARAALENAEEVLFAAAHQVHGVSARGRLPRASAVEVDGALIVIDPRDPGDEGNRVHVVELADVVRFGASPAEPGEEASHA